MADGCPDVPDIRGRRHLVLALAVVAERRGLDYRWRPDACNGIPQLVKRGGAAEGRGRKTAVGEELLFTRALLRRLQCDAAGPHRRNGLNGVNRIDRHVLELERHDIDV